MSERLKSIRAEFEEYGEVGLGSTMWLLDTCAALTAELARVKAESLRVVPVGDAVAIADCDSKYFAHGGHVYEIPDGEFCGVLLGHEGPHYIGFYGDSAIVQPVRLERWEAEV